METEKTSNAVVSKHSREIKTTTTIPSERNIREKILPTLPEEIVAEILSWLPIKSLLKFRCVSKPWRSLISNQQFIKTHLKNSTQNPDLEHHMVVASILRKPDSCLKGCSLRSLLYEPVTDGLDFDYPMNGPDYSVRVVGCCNGLVCILVDAKYFYIWNPCTKEFRTLPDIDDKVKRSFIVSKHGFGYDECSDDYKVFGVMSVFWYYGKYECRVKVYSLKGDCWRKVEGKFTAGSPFDDSGKFVGGRLHWGRREGVECRWDIDSFDLGTHVCGVVEKPNYAEGVSWSALGVLRGCLCVVGGYSGCRLDVWIMREYGVRESWSMVLRVPCYDGPLRGPYGMPLCVGPRGEILNVFGERFLIYDPNDGSFRHPETNNFDDFFEAHVYVESLVSPFCFGGEQVR